MKKKITRSDEDEIRKRWMGVKEMIELINSKAQVDGRRIIYNLTYDSFGILDLIQTASRLCDTEYLYQDFNIKHIFIWLFSFSTFG